MSNREQGQSRVSYVRDWRQKKQRGCILRTVLIHNKEGEAAKNTRSEQSKPNANSQEQEPEKQSLASRSDTQIRNKPPALRRL